MPLSICISTVVWVDHVAAVDPAHHALDLQLTVLAHRDLGHLADDGAEAFVNGHAAAPAAGQRRAPAGLLGDDVEDAQPVRTILQQLPPQLIGVLAAGMRHLVDEVPLTPSTRWFSAAITPPASLTSARKL